MSVEDEIGAAAAEKKSSIKANTMKENKNSSQQVSTYLLKVSGRDDQRKEINVHG